MSQETTYLELSEVDSAHKFYEVIVDNATLTVRYGRIGDQGQIKASAYPDNARARAAAAKKIGGKVRKGYAPAVPGVRQKRTVSRRQIVSTRLTAHTAPVLWRYDSGAPAFGIFVDGQHCMVGNEHGVITTLDHDAQVRSQVRLPDGVKCIVADDAWIYAGCDDGNVYDLSGKVPRKLGTGCGSAYSMQYHDDRLYVVTTGGHLACIDASEPAIRAAQAGNVPEVRDVKAPRQTPQPVQPTVVEVTSDVGAADRHTGRTVRTSAVWVA